MRDKPSIIWGPLRSLLQDNFDFDDIKSIAGLAGLDLTQVSHLHKASAGGAGKGQLMNGLDAVYAEMDREIAKRFLRIVAEEILWRKPNLFESLQEYLSRLGWTIFNGSLVPIEILDHSELPELPVEAHADLVKAATRLRDGDLSGAISGACGAVDAVTSSIFAEESLGDPGNASFQERVNKSLKARGVILTFEEDLASLGWDTKEIKPFKENLTKSLNQAAYVMQTLRSQMGDAHGTKTVLKPLVFDSLKWAALIVRLLKGS